MNPKLNTTDVIVGKNSHRIEHPMIEARAFSGSDGQYKMQMTELSPRRRLNLDVEKLRFPTLDDAVAKMLELANNFIKSQIVMAWGVRVELETQAAEKGYKPGWVFYRLKDQLGYTMANAITKMDDPTPTDDDDAPEGGEPVTPTDDDDAPEGGEPVTPTDDDDAPEGGEPVTPTDDDDAPEGGEPVTPTDDDDAPEGGEPVTPTVTHETHSGVDYTKVCYPQAPLPLVREFTTNAITPNDRMIEMQITPIDGSPTYDQLAENGYPPMTLLFPADNETAVMAWIAQMMATPTPDAPEGEVSEQDTPTPDVVEAKVTPTAQMQAIAPESERIAQWVAQCTRKTAPDITGVKLGDSYQSYCDWCAANGHTVDTHKKGFQAFLVDMGFDWSRRHGWTNMVVTQEVTPTPDNAPEGEAQEPVTPDAPEGGEPVTPTNRPLTLSEQWQAQYTRKGDRKAAGLPRLTLTQSYEAYVEWHDQLGPYRPAAPSKADFQAGMDFEWGGGRQGWLDLIITPTPDLTTTVERGGFVYSAEAQVHPHEAIIHEWLQQCVVVEGPHTRYRVHEDNLRAQFEGDTGLSYEKCQRLLRQGIDVMSNRPPWWGWSPYIEGVRLVNPPTPTPVWSAGCTQPPTSEGEAQDEVTPTPVADDPQGEAQDTPTADDTVAQWVAHRTSRHPDPRTPPNTRAAIVYTAYKAWCRETETTPVSRRQFGASLRQFYRQERFTDGDGWGWNVYPDLVIETSPPTSEGEAQEPVTPTPEQATKWQAIEEELFPPTSEGEAQSADHPTPEHERLASKRQVAMELTREWVRAETALTLDAPPMSIQQAWAHFDNWCERNGHPRGEGGPMPYLGMSGRLAYILGDDHVTDNGFTVQGLTVHPPYHPPHPDDYPPLPDWARETPDDTPQGEEDPPPVTDDAHSRSARAIVSEMRSAAGRIVDIYNEMATKLQDSQPTPDDLCDARDELARTYRVALEQRCDQFTPTGDARDDLVLEHLEQDPPPPPAPTGAWAAETVADIAMTTFDVAFNNSGLPLYPHSQWVNAAGSPMLILPPDPQVTAHADDRPVSEASQEPDTPTATALMEALTREATNSLVAQDTDPDTCHDADTQTCQAQADIEDLLLAKVIDTCGSASGPRRLIGRVMNHCNHNLHHPNGDGEPHRLRAAKHELAHQLHPRLTALMAAYNGVKIWHGKFHPKQQSPPPLTWELYVAYLQWLRDGQRDHFQIATHSQFESIISNLEG